MSEDEQHAMLDECLEHNDHLRANGHVVAEVPLQPPETAVILYWENGKAATTDGPYAETKEQLGGLQILEARDLNPAIQLMSQHPGLGGASRGQVPLLYSRARVRRPETRRALR